MDEYLSSFSLNLFYNMRKVEEHKLTVNKPFSSYKKHVGQKEHVQSFFKKKITFFINTPRLRFSYPFNSQKWLKWNFFLQYSYIIQQKGNENIQTYQIEAAILIKHQVFTTNLQGNV